MQVRCLNCTGTFHVENEDQAFYQKLGVPKPSWCPTCRELRRMAWCNEGVLYNNNCQLCGKKVISQYSKDSLIKAYCVDCWWSNKWDAGAYRQDINLNSSIFDQIHRLVQNIPHCHTNTDPTNENSEYTHHAGHQKNCYMMFHCSLAEDCYYGYGVKKSRNCVDCHYCHESELCFECVDVRGCYDLAWSQNCHNCVSSRFLLDCIGCSNCFLSTGLVCQEYYFLNQKFSKQEYFRKIKSLNLGSRSVVADLKRKFHELKGIHNYRALHIYMSENSLGDNLYNAKNARYCFDCSDIEDSKYCSQLQLGSRHSYDIYQFGIEIELCYESAMIGYNIYNCWFCYDLLQQCSDLQYCISCHSCRDCFGCFGLKKQQYCIFNKQYSKDQYFELLPKLVNKMKKDGEYGEFFPLEHSPHAYNETIAYLWHPLKEQEVNAKGWKWQNISASSSGPATLETTPDDIVEVENTILIHRFKCICCGRNYKLCGQELSFYRTNNYPVPSECFQCRRMRRLMDRNPRTIWERSCSSCNDPIQTNIASSRPEKVFCEKCHLAME